MNEELKAALLSAADSLERLPPMLKDQYVATLRLYANEPWRMGGRCINCGEPIYLYEGQHWRHTNGMFICVVQLPGDQRPVDYTPFKATPPPEPKPVTLGDGFPNYCNTCGGKDGRHSYHCHTDR